MCFGKRRLQQPWRQTRYAHAIVHLHEQQPRPTLPNSQHHGVEPSNCSGAASVTNPVPCKAMTGGRRTFRPECSARDCALVEPPKSERGYLRQKGGGGRVMWRVSAQQPSYPQAVTTHSFHLCRCVNSIGE